MIDYIGRFVSSVSSALEVNKATLSGCIDVIVVEHEDGTMMCTPFNVRFGKLKLWKCKEKLVTIEVNGKETDLKMKLGVAGDGFFEEQLNPLKSKESTSDGLSDISSDISAEDKIEINSSMSQKDKEDREKKLTNKVIKLWTGIPKDAIQAETEKKNEMVMAAKKLLKRAKISKETDKMSVSQKLYRTHDEINKQNSSIKQIDHNLDKENRAPIETTNHPIEDKEEKVEVTSHGEKEEENNEEETEEEDVEVENEDQKRGKNRRRKGIVRSFFDFFKEHNSVMDLGRKAESSIIDLPLRHSEDSLDKDIVYVEDEKDNKLNLDSTASENNFQTHTDTTGRQGGIKEKSELLNNAVIELSLCANDIDGKEKDELHDIFLKHKVELSDFLKDPDIILSNPNLMVRIDNKLYSWKVGFPVIVSLLIYNQTPPEEVINGLSLKQSLPTSSFWKRLFNSCRGKGRARRFRKNREKPTKQKESKVSKEENLQKSNNNFEEDEKLDMNQNTFEKIKSKDIGDLQEKEPVGEKDSRPIEENQKYKKKDSENESENGDLGNIQMKASITEKPSMITEKQILKSNLKEEEMVAKLGGKEIPSDPRKMKVRRTLRPTSTMLKSLNLQYGCNTIVYKVKSGKKNDHSLTANIFLWSSNAKIILSDIDGTITKFELIKKIINSHRSDALGQIMPMMGRDWSQPGVCSLYTNIKKNGYEIVYLTARAIGQSQLTKNFLTSLKQGSDTLPLGPVVLSPDLLIPSFKREVIYRKPEVFKIAYLRDLRSIFPISYNPFYAGFGNRETDAFAYQAVGVPNGKTFTINPIGEIRLLNATYAKSYGMINDLVNEMFPGIEVDDKYQASEEYNQVNYFKINYETLLEDFDVSEIV